MATIGTVATNGASTLSFYLSGNKKFEDVLEHSKHI